MLKRLIGLAVVLGCVLAAPAALAQDKYTRADGIRDKFTFRAGMFFANHNTFTRLQPSVGPEVPGVDLETDTKFSDSTNDFRAQVGFKLGRRHQLKLSFVNMNRDTTTTISGEIEWGDEVFPINSEVTGFWDTQVIKLDYEYAIIKRERVDVHLGLGVFIMRVASGLDLAGGGVGVRVGEDVRKTAPLPMLGAGVDWNFSDRWMFRGNVQLLGISIDDTVDGSWIEARGAVEYSFADHFGLGAGFVLADVDVDLQLTDAAIREFQYQYKFSGPTIYAFANF
jgi:hypothetical protein